MTTMSSNDLLWLIIFISLMQPVLRQNMIEYARDKFLRRLEQRRGSRVISIVHREESMSVLGFPLLRYINVEDSESVLRAVRLTDADVPIDVILHTPGGLSLPVEQIVHALRRHKGRVTVFVPHYAMSGAALIALAADELVMAANAVLGAVDPVVGEYPAASVLKITDVKPLDKIEDKTLLLAEEARKSVSQMRRLVTSVLSGRMDSQDSTRLAESLTSGQWTQDYPISVDELRGIGLPVSTDMPLEVFQLMNLYPQTGRGRPAVDFIPVPYGKPLNPGGSKE